MALSYNNIGDIYYDQEDFSKAIDYYKKHLKINQQIGDKERIGFAFNNIGLSYKTQGNFKEALEYFFKSLKIEEEIGNKKGIASAHNNIGIIYYYQKNYEQTLVYYDKSLKIDEEIGNKQGVAVSYMNIGLIYENQGNYEKALEYYYKSLKIKEEMDDKSSMANLYNNIGNICKIKGKFDEALAYYDKGLKIAEQLGDKKEISNSYINLSRHSFDQNNYTNALALSTKALSIAQEIGVVIGIRNASDLLYQVYRKKGQHAKALEMYELYIQMSDSIINEENTRAMVQQEYKFQYEKEQAVSDAKHQEQMVLSVEREKRQQLISYGASAGLLLVLVFAFLIYNRFKKTQRQKKIIQQKNKNITESITYARRIQEASLTSIEYLKKVFDEYFILYQPKDIVSGDFYWVHEIDNDKVMVAVCDCTGHGIPGAFMSMIGTSLLNEIIIENSITQVDQVLDQMRSRIIKALKQDKGKAQALDGLDMTLLLMDKSKKTIHFAGAGHKLYITGNEGCKEIKGDSSTVGYLFGKEKPFTMKKIQLDENETIYLTSDGLTDQFGGKNRKKFGRPAFMQLLSSIKDEPMAEQKSIVDKIIADWKGNFEQIDDICVMGIRV